MRRKSSVIVFSLVSLIVLISAPDAFAAPVILDTANTGNACESLGGIWDSGTFTCSRGGDWTIWDDAVIESGVTLHHTEGEGISLDLDIPSGVTVTNYGTIMVDREGVFAPAAFPDSYVGATMGISGTVINEGDIVILNNATATTLDTYILLQSSGKLFNSGSIDITNQGSSIAFEGTGSSSVQLSNNGLFVDIGETSIHNNSPPGDGSSSATASFFNGGQATLAGILDIRNDVNTAPVSFAQLSNYGTATLNYTCDAQVDVGGASSVTIDRQNSAQVNQRDSPAVTWDVQSGTTTIFACDEDTTAPTSTISAPPGLTTSDPDIAGTTDDGTGNGVVAVELFNGVTSLGLADGTSTWAFTLPSESFFDLTAHAIDFSGNIGISSSSAIQIDQTPPQVISAIITDPTHITIEYTEAALSTGEYDFDIVIGGEDGRTVISKVGEGERGSTCENLSTDACPIHIIEFSGTPANSGSCPEPGLCYVLINRVPETVEDPYGNEVEENTNVELVLDLPEESTTPTATIITSDLFFGKAGLPTVFDANVVTAPMLMVEQPFFAKQATISGTGFPPNMDFCIDITQGCGNTDAAGNFAFNFNWPSDADDATTIVLSGPTSDFTGSKSPNAPDTEILTIPLSPQGSLTVQERSPGGSAVIRGNGFPDSCTFTLNADSTAMGAGNSGDGNWGFNFGQADTIDAATEFTWIGTGIDDCSQSITFDTIAGGPYPKDLFLPNSSPPLGTVTFSGEILGGTFSDSGECTLSPVSGSLGKSSCQISYTQPVVGDVTITGAYSGSLVDDSSVGTLFFTILPTNSPPVATDDQYNTDEDNSVSGNVITDVTTESGADYDVDGDTILVTNVITGCSPCEESEDEGDLVEILVPNTEIPLPSGAILTISPDGTFTYDPNGEFEHLGTGDSFEDYFEYSLNDGTEDSNDAYVDIYITGVNDAPVITIIGDNPVDFVEAGTAYVDSGATALDAEEGDLTSSIITTGNTIDTENPNTHQVDYSVTDNDSNPLSDNDSRIVIVRDTIAPILSFTIDGDDRVEADELQQGSFQFDATATDAPRTTIPAITCIDEDALSHTNVTGGTLDVPVTFGLGITTVTCTADDGSNSSAEDPTDPADVDTDSASNDFIVSEIFIDEITNTTPMWDESLTITGTVYGFLPGENINATFGTDAIDIIIPITGTDPDAGFAWESTHAFSKETSTTTQTIFAELVENPAHANSTSQDVTIAKHPTAFTGLNSIDADFAPIFWGDTVAKSGTLIDTFTNSGISSEFVNISGAGLGVIAFDTLTNPSGFFEEKDLFTIDRTALGVDIQVNYFAMDNDGVENQFYEPAISVSDSFDTLIHPTILSLKPIDPVTAGFDVNIRGSLIDAHTNTGIPGKQITYITVDPTTDTSDPEFSVSDKTTLQPITFLPGKDSEGQDRELVVDACPTCTEGSSVLRLIPGDYVVLPDNPEYVVLSLEDMGTDIISILVTPTEGSSFQLEGQGQGDNVGVFTIGDPNGISRIDVISSVVDGGNVNVVLGDIPTEPSITVSSISKIQTLNSFHDTTFTTNFVPGTYSSLVFADGFAGGLETTPLESANGFIVTSVFAGDTEYSPNSSPNPTQTFDTIFNPPVKTSGGFSSGVVSSVSPDSGIGITSVLCADGNDADNDALCDDWEGPGNGIPYVVDGNIFKYPLLGTDPNTKNILVEIDYHTSHKPNQQSLDDVAASFTTYDIDMIQDVDDEITPHIDLLNVWNDDDLDFSNDFNSIKSQFFGNSDERVTLSGTQTNQFTNNIQVVSQESLKLNFDDTVTDQSGNANDGTISDGVDSFVTGKVGTKAFDFTGSNYVTISDDPSLNFDKDDPFSISYWIKTDGSGAGWIVSKNDAGWHGINNYFRYNKVSLYLYDSNNIYAEKVLNTRIDDGTWHHVAITYDGSGTATGINYYVDGTLDTNTTIFKNGASLTGSLLESELLTIGGSSQGTQLTNAAIDDLRIHSTKLDTSQVNELFNTVSDPIAYYPFDDTVTDQSGNANDGTISDGVDSFVTGKVGTKAFDFTGSNYVTISDDPSLNFDKDDPFSISYWIKTDGSGAGWIVSKNDAGWHGINNYFRYNKVSLYLYDSNNIYAEKVLNTRIDDGTWHHVAITYDGSGTATGINYYVDGTLDTNTTIFKNGASLTGSLLESELLTIGGSSQGTQLTNAAIDDLRIHNFELKEGTIETLVEPITGASNLVTFSGLSLTTPANSVTDDKTEGKVIIKAKITTAESSTVGYDVANAITISGADSNLLFDSPTATVSITLEETEKILKVTVPYKTTGAVTSGSLGTISVPLDSDSDITNIETISGSPSATSTLLEAKAQAYRYVLFTHSIGGSSGQAELRGNDAIVALGDGFTELDASHDGSEGSVSEAAGTYMHELGHLLNLQHGGPQYLGNDEEQTTLSSSSTNCNPLQKSVMTYSGQLPAYLGDDWSLQFNELNNLEFNENTAEESKGADLGGETIVWATPASTIYDFIINSATIDVPLDWNGNNVVTDIASSDEPFDVNNFGISGCEASPGQILKVVNEPDNFDFNFRAGPTGQFDATVALFIEGQPETQSEIIKQIKLSGAEFKIKSSNLIEEGTTQLDKKTGEPKLVTAGKTIPMRFFLVEKVNSDADPILITDAKVRANQVSPDGTFTPLTCDECVDGFAFVHGDDEHYHFNWKTDESFAGGTYGVQFIMEVPDGQGGIVSERVLIVSPSINPIPHIVAGHGVSIIVEFKEDKNIPVVPTADAGENQTVEENLQVTLDGTASTDPNDDVLTYFWTQVSGEIVTLSDPTSDSPTFTAPEVADGQSILLEFNLEISDGNGHTDSENVQITVNSDLSLPVIEDGFTIDGEVNPTSFTTSGDILTASITAMGVDFDNLKKIEIELKDSNKNKIKLSGIPPFTISGNTASIVVTGISTTFSSGDLVSFKIKAEDNDKNKSEFQLQIIIG